MRTLSVMQGRLSHAPKGVIQHFPVDEWELEFEKLSDLRINNIEWTIDEATFDLHPLVGNFSNSSPWVFFENGLPIPNKIVTCDFFMQIKPFQYSTPDFSKVELRFSQLLNSKSLGSSSILVVPFVDNGAPHTSRHWKETKHLLIQLCKELSRCDSSIAIEFEIEPKLQKRFVEQFPSEVVGINFDMGNSAALGFEPASEIQEIAGHIKNIHVKDRVRGGTTVPLGTGSVDFKIVSTSLEEISYEKNLTLQCARIPDEDPVDVVREYVKFCRLYGLI